MTTTYEPDHPSYLDEADVRRELARVAEVCHGCQRCVSLCGVFPTLFESIDRIADRDPGRMTPAEQDDVIDQCLECRMCAVGCPYVPDLDAASVDFPRLMLRAKAMLHATGQRTARERAAARVVSPNTLAGRAASATSPESAARRIVAAVTGLSAKRMLPPRSRQRFSTWFERRDAPPVAAPQRRVTVYPSCFVEHSEPSIGRDLVAVYEHNRVACSLSSAGCCGAPLLEAGDLRRFTELARRNVRALAVEIGDADGQDVVVPDPTCSLVIKQEYPRYVPGPDAERVAAHTHDAAAYLLGLHAGSDTTLDTRFEGAAPVDVTYHAPCHLRAQDAAAAGADLLALTGARVTTIERCAGTGTGWGLQAAHESVATDMARRLGEQVTLAGGADIVGACGMANTAIAEQTGQRPSHPISVMARAYGIATPASLDG